MEFKLKPIEIPKETPFAYDALDRKESVESVAALIEELTGPFVLAINSPWGTGKTIFVKFVKTTLEAKNIACLYFNAWETDFVEEILEYMNEEIAPEGFARCDLKGQCRGFLRLLPQDTCWETFEKLPLLPN